MFMKKIHFLFIFFLIIGFFFSFNSVFAANNYSASSSYSHVIELNPGWNVFSAPRVVENHEFSASETLDNFDIYLLKKNNISGWSTMAELGQTEFTPLFGYFVYNKTLRRHKRGIVC